ncbi:MAG TPA: DUF1634 domain-containing protein [Bdellovibrionota bacterium]|nr:DUF1634 domain-containing protein [Bdellovibrionota bacterium]
MSLLSKIFSYMLGASMALLLSGVFFKIHLLMSAGLVILISIPICRAVYSTVWFYKSGNARGTWFSVAVLVALAISMFWHLH